MKYYIIHNGNIMIANSQQALSDYGLTIKELPSDYEDNKYIVVNNEIVLNPDWEEIKKERERARKDMMTLTPADVERALYKAKGMDFDDVKELILTSGTGIDPKALAIEFRAKDFYRGAMFGNRRLFDVIGALLKYTPDDIDYLFEHKELPDKREIN